MVKHLKKLWAVAMVVMLLGCATAPMTPTARYYDSLATFNDVVESYLWHYQKVDAEHQAILKQYVDPMILKASTALDIWGQNYNNPTNMQLYLDLFRELQLLLIKYGVGATQ